MFLQRAPASTSFANKGARHSAGIQSRNRCIIPPSRHRGIIDEREVGGYGRDREKVEGEGGREGWGLTV